MSITEFADDFDGPGHPVGLDAPLRPARGASANGRQPRSMAAVWMVASRTSRHACGEICIFEVFGDAWRTDPTGRPPRWEGVHPFRDPPLSEEWEAVRMALDVAEFHVYAADWQPGRVDFFIDGEHRKIAHQAPDYPMQMMVGVFDFPGRAGPAEQPAPVPGFAVDYVRGVAA